MPGPPEMALGMNGPVGGHMGGMGPGMKGPMSGNMPGMGPAGLRHAPGRPCPCTHLAASDMPPGALAGHSLLCDAA